MIDVLGSLDVTLDAGLSVTSGVSGFMPFSSFGMEGPARIGVTASLFLENSAIPPGVPVFQPLIPFSPIHVITGDQAAAALTATDTDLPPQWQMTGSRLDLTFTQGDDVILPIQIQDPALSELGNIATQTGWTWGMEIRQWQNHFSPLIGEWTAVAKWVPPVPIDQPLGYVDLRLLFPAALNTMWGIFRYDIRSVSPLTDEGWPRPASLAASVAWPPTALNRTWVYGLVYIAPRVSDIGALPGLGVPLQALGAPSWPVTVTPTGIAVGESGRVSA